MDELYRIIKYFSEKTGVDHSEIEKNITSRKFDKEIAYEFLYFQEDPEINPFLLLMTKYYDQCPYLLKNYQKFYQDGLQNQMLVLYYGLVNLAEKKELQVDVFDILKRLDTNLHKAIKNKSAKFHRIKAQMINTFKYTTTTSGEDFSDFCEIDNRIIGICNKEILMNIVNATSDEMQEFLDQEIRVFYPSVETDSYNFDLIANLEVQQKHLVDEIVNHILSNFDYHEEKVYDLLEHINEQLMNIEYAFETQGQTITNVTNSEDAKAQYNQDYDKMAVYLKENIIGQDEQIEKFIKKLQVLNFVNIKDKGAKAVFLLAGPTGVGKTELAKLTSKFSNMPLIRMDMSEYKEMHTVSKIYGSPPGYVGYDDCGNKVFDKVVKNRKAIILLDEIEKAHPRVLDVFLHIFDEGKAKDNRQNEIDFSDTTFILTTNIGSLEATKSPIGFNSADDKSDVYRDAIEDRLLPEFINRIDEVIYFKNLEKVDIEQIINLCLDRFTDNFHKKGYEYNFNLMDDAVEYLVAKIDYQKYGARDVFRVLSEEVVQRLIDVSQKTKTGTINISGDEELVISHVKPKSKKKTKKPR